MDHLWASPREIVVFFLLVKKTILKDLRFQAAKRLPRKSSCFQGTQQKAIETKSYYA